MLESAVCTKSRIADDEIPCRSGELRGPSLLRLIDEGVLRHISPEQLTYDLARWGTAELSLSARQERREFFGYVPIDRSRWRTINSMSEINP